MPDVTFAAAGALSLRDLVLGVAERGRPPRRLLEVPVLDLPPGSSLGIAGPSGSGKTTLLHALVGIATPLSGRIAWGGTVLTDLPPAGRDEWRRRHVGMVFQEFHLIDGMDALGNVLLPTRFSRWGPTPREADAARALLHRIGLPAGRQPVAALSRGERQRVALARALLGRPALLVADEPTASLDDAAAATVATLLLELAAEAEATLLVASHDPRLLGRLERRGRIEAGVLLA
ncbi:ATP-binding cassette domain-containing protein (plasmid) [Roseomonas sp. OT10]|uniref:ABC transporter ATP-binding protein n=1 Tax=Roseomonas cutis TaxID=2897332 RepID=UPI001E4A1C16|nr:ATP-binding cassette domain-containing protein [Roseomonas sp. OT10]UFN51643.1 ATP-binding cassette domain-containing protein [Roseomonas sp. OT10]